MRERYRNRQCMKQNKISFLFRVRGFIDSGHKNFAGWNGGCKYNKSESRDGFANIKAKQKN
jgi:hypothetical protein